MSVEDFNLPNIVCFDSETVPLNNGAGAGDDRHCARIGDNILHQLVNCLAHFARNKLGLVLCINLKTTAHHPVKIQIKFKLHE